MKTMTLLLVTGLCLVALAAGGTAVAPQSATSHKPQATTYGAEAITIPQMLSYQGKLTDTLGQPVPNGNYALTFRLYNAPTGGSAIWSEAQTIMAKNGLFSVLLGSVTPIGSVPAAGALYLGMTVAGGTELTPRLRIASAAYAFLTERAANADLLQGKDTTGFVRTGQASSVTSAMITDATIAASDLGSMGASAGMVMMYNGSAWVPSGDSGGSGFVTSVSQATGVVCSPNPITSTGTVGFDQTYGDGRYERVANKNAASGYCGLDGSTKVPNTRLYTGTGNGLDADLLDGNHSTAFAPASGSGNYIQNQSSASQSASWKIVGQGQDSSSTGTALRGVSTYATGFGVQGQSTNAPGLSGISNSTQYGAIEGVNNASSGTGFGVSGFGTGAAIGVYGNSSSHPGVYGNSGSSYGVEGVSSSSYGAYDSSSSSYGVYGVGTCGVYGKGTSYDGVYGTSAASNYAGVYGISSVTGTGTGIGVYGKSPSYWGVRGYRYGTVSGSGYDYDGMRGGTSGLAFYGDTFSFGTAGYTFGDYIRTGGVIGADANAYHWGALGYRNSSGTWYGGYGTSGWSSGSGLSSRDEASGIGCGYGGGLMGGWLKGRYYGATVSGDRYALYAKGNSYTSGYSAELQDAGGKREAVYGTTSTSVDIYTSGVGEMHNGQATVSFPASFAATVSKDVPVVVTATPTGPAPIYLSSSDNKGFAVSAVDAKSSVKFSWIAVGRRAGYETNPEVPAELCRTDFDSKMDGVMSDENDLKHPAQPVWFDGTQLRFDTPPQEPARPKPAQPVNVGLQAPPQAPVPVVPARSFTPSTAPIPSTTTAPVPRQSAIQSTGAEK
jgi:hypothetical protein